GDGERLHGGRCADDRAGGDARGGRVGRQLRDDGGGERGRTEHVYRDVCGGQFQHHEGGGDGDGGRRHQGLRHDGPSAECDGDRLHGSRCADGDTERDERAGRGGPQLRDDGDRDGGRADELQRDVCGGQLPHHDGGGDGDGG